MPLLASSYLQNHLISIVEPLGVGMDHAAAVFHKVVKKRSIGLITIITNIAEQSRGDDELGGLKVLDDATFGQRESGRSDFLDKLLWFGRAKTVICPIITIALDNKRSFVWLV